MTESSKTNEFLRLLMANQKRIYAFILATVPNRQDADDLFQETVLLMWSKFDDFQRGTSFVAWGITVAKYQILSVRKRHSVRSLRFRAMALELLHSESGPFLEQIDGRTQALQPAGPASGRRSVRETGRTRCEATPAQIAQKAQAPPPSAACEATLRIWYLATVMPQATKLVPAGNRRTSTTSTGPSPETSRPHPGDSGSPEDKGIDPLLVRRARRKNSFVFEDFVIGGRLGEYPEGRTIQPELGQNHCNTPEGTGPFL